MKYTPTSKALNSFKSMFRDINRKMEDLARDMRYMHQVTSSSSETHIAEISLNKNLLINKRAL
jgi:hypothetical protein